MKASPTQMSIYSWALRPRVLCGSLRKTLMIQLTFIFNVSVFSVVSQIHL